MMPTTYVVTGASRGLGLELVRQLLSTRPENRVIALARNPSMAKGLNELVKTKENEGRGWVLKADVTDEPSLQAAAKEIEASSFGKNGIDVLINNAGIAQGAGTPRRLLKRLSSIPSLSQRASSSVEEFRANFETNVIGVVQSTLALLPLLRKGSKKQIFVISSGLGSIGGGYQVSWAATYSASKTAVNMWTVKLARELEPEGFTVVLQCPGHVQTDMGGKDASLTPYDSINGVLNNTIYKVGPSDTGKFFNQSGGQNPW